MTDDDTDAAESSVVDPASEPGGSPAIGLVDTLSPASLAPAELAPGTRLGRFCIEARLGAGAMGVVYTARDEQLGRKVAVKLVTSPHGDAPTTRFLREAQVMARLAHPNVAVIYEAGSVDGRLFIAMELVEGETVAAWLGRPHPWREALALFLQAGRGLAAAHSAGVVHRDFKPANVLVGEGRARVVDFGLASVNDEPIDESLARGSPVVGAGTLTQTGMVLGTPAYMAPEQRAGERATAASDQYSYCVALWEALAGVRPGPNGDGARRRPPRVVARVIARGLAADPDERWPDMSALLDALERAARARRVVAGASILAVAAGIAGGVAVLHGTPSDPCTLAHVRLAGVWDTPRKMAISAGFAATNLPYAERQWQSVEQIVDRYTDAWATHVDQTCKAVVAGDLTQTDAGARRSCLDRRLDHLRTWLDVFAAPDEGMVSDAARAATGLEDLATCDTPDDGADVRPADPVLASVVEGLLAQLDAADLRATYRDYTAGVADLRAVLAAAKRVGYQPLIVRVLEQLAFAQQTASELKDAIVTWLEVRDLAEASHQDLVRARAWLGLTFAYGNLSQFAQAHDAARVATSIVQPLSGLEARVIRAGIDEEEANVYWGEGDLEKALELLRRGLRAEYEAHAEHDPFQVAATEVTLGGLLGEMGQYDAAAQHLQLGLDQYLAQNGNNHPAVAAIVNNQGNLYFFKGDYTRAVERYREALAIRDRAGIPADNLGRGYNWMNLGESLVHLKRADEAADALARARAILSVKLGEDNAYFTELLAWIGLAELGRGRAADALPSLERSVKEYRARAESKPADVAIAELGLARALWDAKPAERGRALDLASSAAGKFAAAHAEPQLAEARAWLAVHAK